MLHLSRFPDLVIAVAWEQRERGGSSYYTRSKRVNGKVVREYVGGGVLGEIAARMDTLERRQREEEAAAWKEERAQMEALEAPVKELCEISEALARTTLIAAGYHRRRGEWRRRRVSPKEKESAVDTLANTDLAPKETLSMTYEDKCEVVSRAARGDEAALPAFRELLDLVPGLVNSCGNLARRAEQELVDAMAGNDLATKESVPRKLKEMREELASSSPSPLERLLVERVVACWLGLQEAELRYTCNVGSFTFPQAEYHERRLDRLHNRYLSAIRTLAQIRKLGPVQINLAEKQVNMVRQ